MPDINVLLMLVFALAAIIGLVAGIAWALMRIGVLHNPIWACILAAAVLAALSQLPGGRILTDWWIVPINAVVVGLPVGLVWSFTRRRHQRKLSADKSAP